MTTRLDFGNMLAAQVPSGATPAEWVEFARRFVDVQAAFQREVSAGTHGFVELAAQRAEHARVLDWAASVRGRYDDVVVLGIGGSALGTTLLQTALLPHAWNELSAEQRAGAPRLHVLDNVDPRTIAARLALVTLDRTLFLVVSKSGGTAETLSQYLLVRSRIEGAGLPVHQHLAFVTDPTQGLLRPVAGRDSIPAFSIPQRTELTGSEKQYRSDSSGFTTRAVASAPPATGLVAMTAMPRRTVSGNTCFSNDRNVASSGFSGICTTSHANPRCSNFK